MRWVMLCAVPAIALAVSARQIYLSKTENLSTWKGGGMGMFAAADNTLGRFVRIYVLTPDGQRLPLLRLTPSQEQLVQKGLWFPSERNFGALADSIKATNWFAANEEIPLAVFNENGQRVNVDFSVRLRELRPAPPRAQSEQLKFGVEVEYWEAVYDIKGGDLRAARAKTFTFKD
jgi:hypothetical protein